MIFLDNRPWYILVPPGVDKKTILKLTGHTEDEIVEENTDGRCLEIVFSNRLNDYTFAKPYSLPRCMN